MVNVVGRFAPKTKDDSVTKRRKDDCSRLIYCDDGEFFNCTTVDIPDIQANDFSVRNNVLLNALGCGLEARSSDTFTTTAGLSSTSSNVRLPINFRMPRTDQAVVKSVNRNPPMMTDNTFTTYIIIN